MDRIRAKINKLIISFASIVLILLVIAVTWQVISRYILNNPSSFTDEFSRFSLIWVGMLGATYAFGSKSHLSIDILENKLSPEIKFKVKGLILLIMISFIITVQIIGGGQLSLNTLGQLSPSLQIRMGVVYSILPFTGIINLMYSIIDIFELIKNKVEVK